MITDEPTRNDASEPGSPGVDPAVLDSGAPDPRRWITLGIILTAVIIASLDSTVLTVALPTILQDFDTTLPALQWVMTGYTLTFAALLIIGGRLSDIFGARQMFIVGAALFGVGSFIASVSPNVATLVIGEAIIEGMGASLMIPATMGILSSTFTGRERGTAFGVWGGAMGAAVAFGPVIGGYLTTYQSWRWAFRINVIVVPFAIAGALLFMRKVVPTGRRQRIDIPGALLIATGMFMLVFSISEGSTYGWWMPKQTLTIAGADLWPVTMPISIVPITFALAGILLYGFYRLELHKERADRDPLFEFSLLRIPTFRGGLSTLVLMAMGQIGFLFVSSLFLQDALHLSALRTGVWLIPSGLFIVFGSQLGARLTHRIGTTKVVRIGLVLEATGLAIAAAIATPNATFWQFLPAFACFGTGIGFAASQLTNVILSGIAPEKSGSASGANTTVRMIGSSLGIAVISAVLSTVTIRKATELISASPSLSDATRDHALTAVSTSGVSFSPPPGTSSAEISTLRDILEHATAAGVRPALLFASVVVAIGAFISLRIPLIGTDGEVIDEQALEVARESEAIVESYAVQ